MVQSITFTLHRSVTEVYTTRPWGERVLAVTGGRETKDPLIGPKLEAIVFGLGIRRLVHGKARGIDTDCENWALRRKMDVKGYAYHSGKGKGGGSSRNGEILREEDPDYLAMFFGGTGTGDMCRQAHARGIPILVVTEGNVWTRWSPNVGEYH